MLQTLTYNLKILKTKIFMDFVVLEAPTKFYPWRLTNYICSYAYAQKVVYPQTFIPKITSHKPLEASTQVFVANKGQYYIV